MNSIKYSRFFLFMRHTSHFMQNNMAHCYRPITLYRSSLYYVYFYYKCLKHNLALLISKTFITTLSKSKVP